MGNGAKKAQRQSRNAKDKSQSHLKTKKTVESITCITCKQPFMTTARGPALENHAKEKHSKKGAECFPDFAWGEGTV